MTAATAVYKSSSPGCDYAPTWDSDASPETQLHVIIIGSELADFEWLCQQWKDAGYGVRAFRSVKAAFEAALVEPPDLWIVSMSLAGIAASELVSMLRWWHPQAKICLFGDADCLDQEITARRAGPDLYFSQPIHSELLEALEEWIVA